MAIIDPEGLFYGERLTFEDVPASSGVYLIFIRDNLAYIGGSKDMRARASHHRCVVKTQRKLNWHPCPSVTFDELRFVIVEIDDAAQRQHTEETLISQYRPPFNRLIDGKRRPCRG